MSQRIEKYKILVASPSDVLDERASIDEVVAELNNTYGNRSNIIIELIKWETHSAPGISQTSIQDLIDKDFGSDYDLFIGIVWKKFGTPTDKYGSGTEQEFNNAFLKFKSDPMSSQILFYFKIAPPITLSDINPLELDKINKFKNDLGEKNVYYWEYNSIEDFQKFLRIHIPMRIDQLKSSNESKFQNLTVTETLEIKIEGNTEELGTLDYQEIIEEAFSNSREATLRITEATSWIGKEITKKTQEFKALSSKNQQVSKHTLRDFFRRTANIYDDYASRIDPDISIYTSNFERGVDAISSLITIVKSDFTSYENEISEAKITLNILLNALQDASIGMSNFLTAVSSLPRVAKELNKARRNVEVKLTELISKLQVSITIAKELEKNI